MRTFTHEMSHAYTAKSFLMIDKLENIPHGDSLIFSQKYLIVHLCINIFVACPH